MRSAECLNCGVRRESARALGRPGLHLTSRQEHSHDRQGHQPVAPAHDRGHDIFLGRSPDQARAEALRRYQLHLASSGISAANQNATVMVSRASAEATARLLEGGTAQGWLFPGRNPVQPLTTHQLNRA